MEIKAFIAHTVEGGIDIARIIKEQLIQSTPEVHSFLSEDAIGYGEHIPEKILKALIESDILFVVLDPLVIENEWVKWEYEFGKKHNIRIICVIYTRFFEKRERIKWLDSKEKNLTYDGRDGMLRNELWNEVDDMMSSLMQQAQNRNMIKMDSRTSKTSYFDRETIKISGNVNGSLIGTAYLHIPYREEERLPIHSTDIITTITPNDDGDFELEFELPEALTVTEYVQKWFIELKFGGKSQLVPISIYTKNNVMRKPNNELPDKVKSSKGNAVTQKKTIQKINEISEGTFLSIPKKIHNHAIRREYKISELMTLLEKNDRIVITGEKGSGKSVFLCQLYKKIAEQRTVLFIRCDDYLSIESFEELNRIIIRGHNCLEYIQNIATDTNKLVIIFDSLDAISRNEKSMNIFKLFLKNVWGTNMVTTISSVRNYDYEYSPSIRNTDWGIEYKLGLLTKNETDAALEKLGNPAISSELKNILFNPLHLKLLSLILERSPNTNFTNIKSEIELYDEHWDEYVEKLEHVDDIRNVLYGIAKKMSATQRIAITHGELGRTDAMNEVLSRNIVLSDSRHDQISFFHHAYLDYTLSRLLLVKHSKFVDFLLENEYNIFLRPTIVFALSMFHKRSPKQFIKVVEKILNSPLKYFWKISALTALARIDRSDEQDFSILGKFLSRETTLQRHFLMEIKEWKSYFWFDLWKNLFLIDWSSSLHNPNGLFIIDYLKSILEGIHDHEPVFRMLQRIVDRNEPSWTGRKAIELSSEINAGGKTDWLHKLSTNNDPQVRTGVLKTLPKLIETNPGAVPEIFCNIFTYAETSDDLTQLITHGTFGLTSTRKQDNSMIIWEAENLFPELLEKNPEQMINTAIKVFETQKKSMLSKYKDNVIEDYGYYWFAGSASRHAYGADKFLKHVIQYLHGCTDKELSELEPLFISTRLATFRSIIIDALVKRNGRFVNKIFNIISDLRVYEITSLRSSVKSAIKEIGPSLTGEQVRGLLDNVMNIGSNRELDEEGIKARDIIRAQFLSAFSPNVLQPAHQKILDGFSEYNLENRQPYHEGPKIEVGSDSAVSTEPDPEAFITNSLGKKLESKKKIELLDAISKYLDRETRDIDNTKIQPIKEFLIANRNDPDPKSDINQDQQFIVHDTVRGLVAKCLVKLLYHSNDSALEPLVKELSDDPINTVRSEVCSVLKYLFDYNYDLAHAITKRYSIDDKIVQLCLSGALPPIVNMHPEHATLIISNILDRQVQYTEDSLIYLAFYKKEPGAIDLLNTISDKRSYSSKIRCKIPFILKESWLFENAFQVQALDLLYKLLDDPDNEVRYNAAFFTLNSFEKNDSIDNKEFVKKIGRHLDRISLEVDRKPLDPRLIEELAKFLKDFWYLLPEKTIYYLEKMTSDTIKEYAAHQPVFAENSVEILTGLFQHTSLSIENRKRCLNILDIYAMAGWNAALQLLAAMERPD